MAKVQTLAYVDIQHDAPAVFDDVEQGVVLREDFWVSGYKSGTTSVHGKVRVEAADGGGVDIEPRDGVRIERLSKSNFVISVPSLGINSLSVRFPRQVINPPYTKKTNVSPELHISSIDYSDKSEQLVIGGTDGYCVVVSPSDTKNVVELKGHVGDVQHVQWFPSGEVVLTASSDLSVRVFSSKTGANPRTLKGHTRAVTATAILGVGRQVLSASKDGTVRLWTVGEAKEAKKWRVDAGRAVDGLVVVGDEAGLQALDVIAEDEQVILAATPDGSISAFTLSSSSLTVPIFVSPPPVPSNLIAIAYSPSTGLIATGHANGITAIRHLSALRPVEEGHEAPLPTLIKRNEAPIYSLAFVDRDGRLDLLVGTGSGLPSRLALDIDANGTITASTKEEYAGWEAVSVESWAVGADSVFCAGGEGGVRRY
ncbi:Proteasomal ATPase-associated factor 1 [Vanrija pseudolonga]|uniref:Proteasomal ATPase-associated factor 1 n=1 Tax=Vanrija pseudolonga TaxID=143232 RepID=A0AAF0Y1X3_9TREE|nr:Proteasomal ATPase-associated factor 1 [Vanrija pseudolonga]